MQAAQSYARPHQRPVSRVGRSSGVQAPIAASRQLLEISQQRPDEAQLKALMLAGLKGDRRSEEALLRAFRPMLTAFFGGRVSGDAVGVEDLVQEVLIAVHEQRFNYDRDRPVKPWLYSIARHKMVDHFRRVHRQAAIEYFDRADIAEAPRPSCEAEMDVARLLSLLPDKQARAIRDTRLREMSVEEAARVAGIGESALKVSAHRGIRKLAARVAAMNTTLHAKARSCGASRKSFERALAH